MKRGIVDTARACVCVNSRTQRERKLHIREFSEMCARVSRQVAHNKMRLLHAREKRIIVNYRLPYMIRYLATPILVFQYAGSSGRPVVRT